MIVDGRRYQTKELPMKKRKIVTRSGKTAISSEVPEVFAQRTGEEFKREPPRELQALFKRVSSELLPGVLAEEKQRAERTATSMARTWLSSRPSLWVSAAGIAAMIENQIPELAHPSPGWSGELVETLGAILPDCSSSVDQRSDSTAANVEEERVVTLVDRGQKRVVVCEDHIGCITMELHDNGEVLQVAPSDVPSIDVDTIQHALESDRGIQGGTDVSTASSRPSRRAKADHHATERRRSVIISLDRRRPSIKWGPCGGPPEPGRGQRSGKGAERLVPAFQPRLSDLNRADFAEKVAHMDMVSIRPPAGVAEAYIVWIGGKPGGRGTVLVRLCGCDSVPPVDLLVEEVKFDPAAPRLVEEWFRVPELREGHWYVSTKEFDWDTLKENAGRLAVRLGSSGASRKTRGADAPATVLAEALSAARRSKFHEFIVGLSQYAEGGAEIGQKMSTLQYVAAHYLAEIRRVLPSLWTREVIPRRRALAALGWLTAILWDE